MIHRLLNLSVLLMFVIAVSSCGKTLSEDERTIVENDLAEILYDENLWDQAKSLDDYLYGAVDAYADKGHDEMQSKIDSYNASSALFGGIWDVAELFGSSTPELYSRTYYRYIDFANDNRGNMADVVKKATKIIVAKPEILDAFERDGSFSFEPFKSIDGLPKSVSAEELQNFKNLSLSKENKAEWGMKVMGTLKNPQFSPTAVVCATLKALSIIDYPTAEYAVYDEEEKGWEIGYDTEDAYFVTFVQKGDILEYEYSPSDYFEGYIDSKNNQLK